MRSQFLNTTIHKAAVSALMALLLFAALPQQVNAATLLSNMSEANDKGDNVFRSNIWLAFKFTTGAAATVDGVTVNLDETESNYTNFSTHTSGVVKIYNDNSGVVGSQVSGTLGYDSSNSSNGHTVYSDGSITLPSAGDYWIAFTCSACANVYIQTTSSTSSSGASDWATVLSSAAISTSSNSGSSWGTPYSSTTYGTAMLTIQGTETDSTAPTVSTFSPADNATSVSTDSNLVITFDEAVDAETGNITIQKTSDSSTLETIDVTSEKVSGSGSATITINPTTTFTAGTSYNIQIPETAFDDAAGNSYAGISDTTTWNFTTAGTAPSNDLAPRAETRGQTGTFLDSSDTKTVPLLPTIFTKTVDLPQSVSPPTASKVAPRATVPVGGTANFALKVPDPDQAQEVYVRINGQKIMLTDTDGDFTYSVATAAGKEPGLYPYTITVNYGIFTLSSKGIVEVAMAQEPMPILREAIDSLFTKAFKEPPRAEEQQHWQRRVEEGTKKNTAELYGAMQWQQQFGVFSTRQPGTVQAAGSPLTP